jgi:hypothetical protein
VERVEEVITSKFLTVVRLLFHNKHDVDVLIRMIWIWAIDLLGNLSIVTGLGRN